MDPVAGFIRREAVHMLECWERSARQMPELAHMTRPVLFDHMFELLDGLAAWIEGEEEIARGRFDALVDGHALQRLGHGVSLPTLIQEYKTLRSILPLELLAVPSSDAVRASLVRLDQGSMMRSAARCATTSRRANSSASASSASSATICASRSA